MVTCCLYNGYVIPLQCQWSCNSNIKSSFVSNQTSNIFHPKILHILFSAFNFPCTNLNITFHTSALAFSREEILHVL